MVGHITVKWEKIAIAPLVISWVYCRLPRTQSSVEGPVIWQQEKMYTGGVGAPQGRVTSSAELGLAHVQCGRSSI